MAYTAEEALEQTEKMNQASANLRLDLPRRLKGFLSVHPSKEESRNLQMIQACSLIQDSFDEIMWLRGKLRGDSKVSVTPPTPKKKKKLSYVAVEIAQQEKEIEKKPNGTEVRTPREERNGGSLVKSGYGLHAGKL